MRRIIQLFFLSLAFTMSGAAFGESNLRACNGSYFGDWNNCFGFWTLQNGDRYLGEWKDGMPNGQGTLTYANGAKYIGELINGKRNGKGTLTYAERTNRNRRGNLELENRDQYIGEFKDDNFNGQGNLKLRNRDQYIGEFKEDSFNGQGTYIYFSNGGKFVGEFKDGKRSGVGTYMSANGDNFLADYVDDEPNGRGVKYDPAGNVTESGIYKGVYLIISKYIDPKSFTQNENKDRGANTVAESDLIIKRNAALVRVKELILRHVQQDIENIKRKQRTNGDSFYFEASIEVHNPGVCNLAVEDNRKIGRNVYNISTSLYFDRMDDAISIMVNNNLPSGGIYNIEPKDYVINVFGKSNNMISSELRISSPWGNLPTRQSWLDHYPMGLNESRSKELLVALLKAIKACNVSLN